MWRVWLWILVMGLGIMHAKTLVVDDDYYMGFPRSICEDGDRQCGMGGMSKCNFSKISNALAKDANGDTIRICPGTYKESNLEIDKNIIIQSTTANRDDVYVGKSSKKPIFKITGWRNGVTIESITIEQKKDNNRTIRIEKGGKNIIFRDLNVTSAGAAIIQNTNNNFENILFDNVYIYSQGCAIKMQKPSGVVLQDINITSTAGKGVVAISPTGDINITTQHQAYNTITSSKHAISLGDQSHHYYIANTHIWTTGSRAKAITGDKAASVTIDHVKIDTDDQGGGIWFGDDVGRAVVMHADISHLKGRAIYFSNLTDSGSQITDSVLDGGRIGIHIADTSHGVTIRDNMIRNFQTYGIKLLDSSKWRSSIVYGNCLINSAAGGHNIIARDRDGDYDDGSAGNYWDDWSGSGDYTIADIPRYDHHPLSTCPMVAMPQAIVEWRMDACRWDGTTGEVIDSSGHSHDGTAHNNASTESNDSAGGVCRVAELNTSKGAYLDMGVSSDYTPAHITVAAWVKPASVNDWSSVIMETNNDWKDGYGMGYYTDGQIHFFVESYDEYDTNTTIKLDEWTHLAATYDGVSIKLYKNGILVDECNTGELNTSSNEKLLIGDSVWSSEGSGTDLWDGMIDEVKIFDDALSAHYIKDIYNRERRGHNYNGGDRVCPHCGAIDATYGFDAWDIYRDINDRNISTKIVGHEFNLTIASLEPDGHDYQEFNGTVCVDLEGNITKILMHDQNTSRITLYSDKVTPHTRVGLSWQRDADQSCPLSHEDNSTRSSDDFAIRPDSYSIHSSTDIYAGEEFDITFGASNATDYNESIGGSFVVDLNDTKAGCLSGSLDYNESGWSFGDGTKSLKATYSEIGDIDLIIHEAIGSEYAKVDIDDTNASVRLISPASHIIHVKPYDINITHMTFTISQSGDWLYMANSLDDMNVTVGMSIDVYNKHGDKMSDFNSSCYGSDLRVKVSYDYDGGVGAHLLLDGNLTDDKRDLADINKTLNIPIGAFTGGEANGSYTWSIDRNSSQPIDPLYIELQDANITTTALSKALYGASDTGSLPHERNVTYYYGRVWAEDLYTMRSSDTHPLYMDVYASDATSRYIEGYFRDSMLWYRNKKHSSSGYGLVEVVDSHGYRSGLMSGAHLDVNISSIDTPHEGQAMMHIDIGEGVSGTMHLDINQSSWLWYVPAGLGGDYDFADGSDCTEHPCFSITRPANHAESGHGVKSGTFGGSWHEPPAETNSSRSGLKVLR